MNKVKFNKFERVAGLFVGLAIFGFIFSLFAVSIKQGWFDRKIYFTTSFVNADGVHPGTAVQIAGLKAGSVEDVELTKENQISVRFYVLSKFEHKIRQDSMAQLVRPFIIGERILDVSLGSDGAKPLAENTEMKSNETVDLMTIMSGRQLGSYMATLSGMMGSLKTLAEALLNKDRTATFVSMFDRVDPLLKNLNTMSLEVIRLSRQATKHENFGVVLGELAITTKQLNALLPEMHEQAPQMAKDLTQLVSNLAQLTEQFKVVIPALAEVAPDLPHASRRAVEALDEAVVLIKAMERSFFVRGSVEDVRREESEERAAKEKNRVPSSDK